MHQQHTHVKSDNPDWEEIKISLSLTASLVTCPYTSIFLMGVIQLYRFNECNTFGNLDFKWNLNKLNALKCCFFRHVCVHVHIHVVCVRVHLQVHIRVQVHVSCKSMSVSMFMFMSMQHEHELEHVHGHVHGHGQGNGHGHGQRQGQW